MAYEIPGFSWTLEAGEDLSDSQYCAVDVNSSGKAVLPVQGKRVVGILRNHPGSTFSTPPDSEAATIVSTGIVKARVGITGVTAGQNVTCDDDGTIIQCTSGDVALGRALQSAVAGAITTVLLQIGAGNIVATS